MTDTPSPNTASSQEEPRCTIYYDGACPLCQREIALYQSLQGADAMHWHDVSQSETKQKDLSTADAMARFHVRRADGTLVSGALGFAEVMQGLPQLRFVGKLLALPPISWVAEIAYRLFLPLRPWLKQIVPAPQKSPRNDASAK